MLEVSSGQSVVFILCCFSSFVDGISGDGLHPASCCTCPARGPGSLRALAWMCPSHVSASHSFSALSWHGRPCPEPLLCLGLFPRHKPQLLLPHDQEIRMCVAFRKPSGFLPSLKLVIEHSALLSSSKGLVLSECCPLVLISHPNCISSTQCHRIPRPQPVEVVTSTAQHCLCWAPHCPHGSHQLSSLCF